MMISDFIPVYLSFKALKLKTIVKGDAPAILATTSLCKKEVSELSPCDALQEGRERCLADLCMHRTVLNPGPLDADQGSGRSNHEGFISFRL